MHGQYVHQGAEVDALSAGRDRRQVDPLTWSRGKRGLVVFRQVVAIHAAPVRLGKQVKTI